MNKKEIKIAFIDDGIDSQFVPPQISFKNLAVYDGVVREAGVEGVSHGAACYTVFRNHVQEPYMLISIKVLDRRNRNGHIKDMLKALEWCGANDIHLIHMSIGTRQSADMPPLYQAVRRLSTQGIIMVAACSNRNTLTFPACFPLVIGVRHHDDKVLTNSFVFLDDAYDNINVMTCASDITLSHGNNQAIVFYAGNSLAAPIVTARVCDYLSNGCVGMEAIKQRLRSDSLKDCAPSGYSFYKQLLGEWKDIDIPVVAILSNNMSVVITKIMELIKLFVRDEYNALGLSPNIETNMLDGVYKLHTAETLNDNLKWFFNFAQPDVILLHISIDDLVQSDCNAPIDVLITESFEEEAKYKLFNEIDRMDINMSTPNLYSELIELLCSEDE